MRAVSASAEEDDSNNTNENKNISPSLKAVPNFTLRGGIGSGDKKKGATADQPIVCYACPPPSKTNAEKQTVNKAKESGGGGGNNNTTNYKHENYLGCKHYHRKCKIVPTCCNVPFPCRFCHDDNSDHAMDRYNTKEMQCMKCALIQPVAKNCKKCNVEMARYFCKVCNLFDDLQDGRHIYHCPFCNVCRKGKGLGQDFFHCMKCNSCVSLVMGPHECLGKRSSMESECPVCKDFMFDSETPVKTLPCGHLMHTSCFETYTRHYYTCPLCRKSLGDFTVYFRMLDAILADERQKKKAEEEDKEDKEETKEQKQQKVKCNDCAEVTMAEFHFVYHACGKCRSYNTVVE
jgi:zinc finger-like protein